MVFRARSPVPVSPGGEGTGCTERQVEFEALQLQLLSTGLIFVSLSEVYGKRERTTLLILRTT